MEYGRPLPLPFTSVHGYNTEFVSKETVMTDKSWTDRQFTLQNNIDARNRKNPNGVHINSIKLAMKGRQVNEAKRQHKLHQHFLINPPCQHRDTVATS